MGRPCEFDEDEVLEAAMRAFWKAGFEGTSLGDIVDATGIGRQSLYNAFGDKRDLFLRCLERYAAQRHALLRQALARGPVPRALEALFEHVLAGADADKRMGCLLINTSMELARRDVEVGDLVARNQRALEAVFEEALAGGKERGELAPALDAPAVARFLVGSLFGLTVLQKGDPRSTAPRDMVKVVLGVLAR